MSAAGKSRRLRAGAGAAAAALAALLLPAAVRAGHGTVQAQLAAAQARLARWDVAGTEAILNSLPAGAGRLGEALRAEAAFYAGDYDEAVRRLAAGEGVHPAGHGKLIRDTRDLVRSLGRRESEHFAVFYDEERDWVLAAAALEVLELSYARLGAWLGRFPERKVRVEIVPTTDGFERISSLSRREIETAGAVGICKFNKIMLLSPRLLLRGYRWRDSLSHEYVHYLLVGRTANRAPLWLQEGVARYGETLWRSERSLHLTAAEESLLAVGIRQDGLISFAAMEPTLVRLPSRAHVRLAFAECAMAVEYILERWGPPGFQALLDGLAGEGGAPAAFTAALGVGLDGFEADWRRYVEDREFTEIPGLIIPSLRVADGPGGVDPEEWDLSRWQPLAARNHLRLGDMLRARKRARAALREYEKAREAAPASPYVLNRMGLALMDLGRTDEAAGRFEEAMRIHPDFVTSYTNLGAAAAALGDWERARRAWEESLEMNPFNPGAWKELGRALARLGHEADRREVWKIARGLDPRDSELREFFGR